jgi:hypothetical protein
MVQRADVEYFGELLVDLRLGSPVNLDKNTPGQCSCRIHVPRNQEYRS